MPLSSSRARSSAPMASVTMVSTASSGAKHANELRPSLVASKSMITLAAIDIISFFVSACVMSGVLAPFSTLRPASMSRPVEPWTMVQW